MRLGCSRMRLYMLDDRIVIPYAKTSPKQS